MTDQNKLYSVSDERRLLIVSQDSAPLLTIFLLLGLSFFLFSCQVFGSPLGQNQQTTEQSGDAGKGAGAEKDVRLIELGKPIRRDLVGGQRHYYRIRLRDDQFLKVVVEQQGIDVVAQVSGPDGKTISEFDSESRLQGQEVISLAPEAPGDYQLIVWPKLRGAPAGHYDIRIEELRAVTNKDRALQEARSLYEEAKKLQRAGKYDEALPLLERALETRERLLGLDHCDAAVVSVSLANLFRDKGDYAKAESLYQRALTIQENALEPGHPDIATSLNNFAANHWNRGNYEKAEPLYQRALSIREKALGPEHPNVAETLGDLATLYRERGDYAKAEPLHQRSLAIKEKALGPEHPDVALSLNSLAILHYYRGDYAKAEPLYQRALSIREKALGPEHPSVAQTLDNLAVLHAVRGDFAKAEPLFQRALLIREKKLGPEHSVVAVSLNNLAELYRDRGEYGRAEPLYQRSLAIWEKALGPEHRNVAASLNNLADLYRRRGEYGRAEPLYQRALSVREKALGPEHPDVAASLDNLADLYRNKGEFMKAEPLYQRALAIQEKALGTEHPDIMASLNNLAALYAARGALAQAVAFQSRANAVGERNFAANLAAGSERQKLAYLALLSNQLDQTISLHVHYAPTDPAARDLAAGLILQRKGRALDATSENLNALRSRFNHEDQALLDQLTGVRAQIARLILGGPQRMTSEQYRDTVKSLEDQAEDFETKIGDRSGEFRVQSLPITLAAVQAAIPADAALIEFASYRPFDARAAKEGEAYGQPHYIAYILRHQGEIQWKELGEVRAIDQAVAALRRALRDPKRKNVKTLAHAAEKKVFRPIRPLVGNLPKLLISPEGSLNLLPFETLADGQGRYLVERYSISYLASGRDLLRLQAPRESQNGPLVIADPDFGGRRQIGAARLLRRKNPRLKNQDKEESPAPVFSQFYFPSLPYTAEEGEALRSLLPGATLLTRRGASKTALSQVRSPELLHIATHGFFLEDLKSPKTGERQHQSSRDLDGRILKRVVKSGAWIENPLLRSGLALAGANEQRKEDNGILTALEMTGLNLWGTKLVTLSACDTGVGEVRKGDGVHGLRRALVLAGAETQVMSLWPVSDRWTRELMVAYYEGLKQGQGRSEALRLVQLKMLKAAKRRHPYYWASFIQSGEWANLEGIRGK